MNMGRAWLAEDHFSVLGPMRSMYLQALLDIVGSGPSSSVSGQQLNSEWKGNYEPNCLARCLNPAHVAAFVTA